MLIIIVRTSGFTNEMSENHFFYSRNFEGIFGSELMVECNLLFLFSTNLAVSNKTMQFLEKFAKVRVRVRVKVRDIPTGFFQIFSILLGSF